MKNPSVGEKISQMQQFKGGKTQPEITCAEAREILKKTKKRKASPKEIAATLQHVLHCNVCRI